MIWDDDAGLGERVIFCELIRDNILQHFNPRKLGELRYVLELRCFKGLLPDEDLKEVYFQRLWGFGEEDFLLDNWREMSVEELRHRVEKAHQHGDSRPAYPPCSADVHTLHTKEEIIRAYGVLARVPAWVYKASVNGARVLRELKERGVDGIVGGNNGWRYVIWACEACLDASVVYAIADRIEKRELLWAMCVVEHSRSPMIGLLCNIYHARPGNGIALVLPRLVVPRVG